MQLFQVDSFADEVFGGNPAAVCLLGGPAGPAWMQSVASEMNLSETAFVEPSGAGYGLRWFTPVAEVDLCGHATLEVLTDREREVLTLVARGWSNAEIAERLYLSAATAKTHVGRLLMKLQARDRTQLVVIAYETGLVTPGTPPPR